jgi:hypothetical protein
MIEVILILLAVLAGGVALLLGLARLAQHIWESLGG